MISSKVSFKTSTNLCPVPISVPIVSRRLINGTNFDSYLLLSIVVLFPIPSFANCSPKISLINVLFPTPLVPMTIKFIFSNSFGLNVVLIIFINFLCIFSIQFSYSKSLSNNSPNFSFNFTILPSISGPSRAIIQFSSCSLNFFVISIIPSVYSLSKATLHFSISSFSFSICLILSSFSFCSFSNNCFSLSNLSLLACSILSCSWRCNSAILLSFSFLVLSNSFFS